MLNERNTSGPNTLPDTASHRGVRFTLLATSFDSFRAFRSSTGTVDIEPLSADAHQYKELLKEKLRRFSGWVPYATYSFKLYRTVDNRSEPPVVDQKIYIRELEKFEAVIPINSGGGILRLPLSNLNGGRAADDVFVDTDRFQRQGNRVVSARFTFDPDQGMNTYGPEGDYALSRLYDMGNLGTSSLSPIVLRALEAFSEAELLHIGHQSDPHRTNLQILTEQIIPALKDVYAQVPFRIVTEGTMPCAVNDKGDKVYLNTLDSNVFKQPQVALTRSLIKLGLPFDQDECQELLAGKTLGEVVETLVARNQLKMGAVATTILKLIYADNKFPYRDEIPAEELRKAGILVPDPSVPGGEAVADDFNLPFKANEFLATNEFRSYQYGNEFYTLANVHRAFGLDPTFLKLGPISLGYLEKYRPLITTTLLPSELLSLQHFRSPLREIHRLLDEKGVLPVFRVVNEEGDLSDGFITVNRSKRGLAHLRAIFKETSIFEEHIPLFLRALEGQSIFSVSVRLPKQKLKYIERLRAVGEMISSLPFYQADGKVTNGEITFPGRKIRNWIDNSGLLGLHHIDQKDWPLFLSSLPGRTVADLIEYQFMGPEKILMDMGKKAGELRIIENIPFRYVANAGLAVGNFFIPLNSDQRAEFFARHDTPAELMEFKELFLKCDSECFALFEGLTLSGIRGYMKEPNKPTTLLRAGLALYKARLGSGLPPYSRDEEGTLVSDGFSRLRRFWGAAYGSFTEAAFREADALVPDLLFDLAASGLTFPQLYRLVTSSAGSPAQNIRREIQERKLSVPYERVDHPLLGRGVYNHEFFFPEIRPSGAAAWAANTKIRFVQSISESRWESLLESLIGKHHQDWVEEQSKASVEHVNATEESATRYLDEVYTNCLSSISGSTLTKIDINKSGDILFSISRPDKEPLVCIDTPEVGALYVFSTIEQARSCLAMENWRSLTLAHGDYLHRFIHDRNGDWLTKFTGVLAA